MCACMYYKYIDIGIISSKEVTHKIITLKYAMFTCI